MILTFFTDLLIEIMAAFLLSKPGICFPSNYDYIIITLKFLNLTTAIPTKPLIQRNPFNPHRPANPRHEHLHVARRARRRCVWKRWQQCFGSVANTAGSGSDLLHHHCPRRQFAGHRGHSDRQDPQEGRKHFLGLSGSGRHFCRLLRHVLRHDQRRHWKVCGRYSCVMILYICYL